jgi:PPOX class probable F420-dependent enzyme
VNGRRNDDLTEGQDKLTAMARQIVDGKNFATVATLSLDGAPQASVVWIDRDGDALVFSTTADRAKAKNLARDPRISISIFDREDPYRSVEIRGTAQLIDDPGKELPKRLSKKYLGEDPPPEPDAGRLIIRVLPTKIIEFAV